jgi:hypothetical protein
MRWVDERRFHFTSLRGREGKRRDSLPRAKRWEPGAPPPMAGASLPGLAWEAVWLSI